MLTRRHSVVRSRCAVKKTLRIICLPGAWRWKMLGKMAASAPDKISNSASPLSRKQLVVKITGLVLIALLLGLGQDWMASRYYGPERVAGFHTGIVHGAVMPAALVTLLMGKDVPIYAQANEGRRYKIGYILGINLCGTLFFGFAFWRPRKRSGVRE